MPVKDDKTWSDNFEAAVPITNSKSEGIDNFVSFIDKEVSGQLTISTPIVGPSIYTWQPSIMKAKLLSISSSTQQSLGAQIISDAWAAATLASSMFVSAGAYVGSPSPATLFLAPPAVVILPPSIELAKVSLFSALTTLEPTKEISLVPVEIRKAFLAIKFSAIGLNSIIPPAGPQPLVVPSSGVE